MKQRILSKEWLKAAMIRAVRTFCQTMIASVGCAVVLEDVNWVTALSASLLAAILSILTSIAGLPEVEE